MSPNDTKITLTSKGIYFDNNIYNLINYGRITNMSNVPLVLIKVCKIFDI